MGMGVTDSPVPVHWVPTPSGPLAWGALPILPFNCTSKETTKVELMSALVEDVNAVGDVVGGDVEDEGAVEDVHPPTDAFTTTAQHSREGEFLSPKWGSVLALTSAQTSITMYSVPA